MLSWGKIQESRKHLVKTPKITPRAFPAFTFYNRWKQRSLMPQCASVEQWLTNRLWGEGCSLTYFKAVSFAQTQKSFNLCNQWLSLPVLRKGACLLPFLVQWTQVVDSYSWVNDSDSADPNATLSWSISWSLQNRLKSSQHFHLKVLRRLHKWC